MVNTTVTIHSPNGLHLRPAGLLAEEALRYESSISLKYKDKTMNAKSLLGVLSLCVRCGTQISLICDGPDEETALKELSDFIENKL